MSTTENIKQTLSINDDIDIHFRIVCKSNKGAFVRVFKENKLYIWEDFNKMFEVRNNIYAYFNPEMAKKINDMSETIRDFTETTQLVYSIAHLGGRVPLLTQMVLGTLSQNMVDLFPNFTMNDIIYFAALYTRLYNKAKNDKIRQHLTENIVTVDIPKVAKTKSGRTVERDIVKSTTSCMADFPGADKLKALYQNQ